MPANDSMQAHDRETAAISLASPRTLPCKLDFEVLVPMTYLL